MSTRIFYFSGSGNALAIARVIAAGLGDTEVLPIAKATGGEVFGRADAGKAFDAVLSRHEGARLVRPTYRRLWDNVFMYLALCGLLCAEWIARKRQGLA